MKHIVRTVSLFALLSSAVSMAPAKSDLIKASGIKGGLVVQLGCDATSSGQAIRDGLMEASDGPYLVHVLEADPEKVQMAREYIQSKGLYGRVSVMEWDGERLPYADNLVNLLVCGQESESRDQDTEILTNEIERVLAPRGVAIAPAGASRIPHPATRIGDEYAAYTKPLPPEIDEWTHYLHGPDGNAVSRDSVVGPPRRLQWMAWPFWARLHDAPSSTSSMVSSGGRVFYISDEGPAGTYEGIEDKWFLVARDAFNGTLLWKKPMPEWGWKKWTASWHARNNQPFQITRRLVAIDDTVYVTMSFNGPLMALDAATGKTVKTYEGTENTDEILYKDGLLVLAIYTKTHEPSEDSHEPLKKQIAVIKADTGEALWKTGDYSGLTAKNNSTEPFGRFEMALGDGRIHFSDHDAIVTLALETGKELWRAPREFGEKLPANFNTRMYELPILVYNDGVVLFAQPEGTTSFHSVPGTLYAYDEKNGKLLWKRRYGGWVHNTQPNVFVIDGNVWIHEHQEGEIYSGKRANFPPELHQKAEYATLGLDLKTGETTLRHSTREILDVGHHHRCYRNKATEKFLLMSRRGVEFINVETGENDLNHWTRGDCQLGVMPCNGLLYTTPHPCSCYIDAKLNGYFALAPAKQNASGQQPDLETLIKGPAFAGKDDGGQALAEPPRSADWPTFRSTASRSGSVKTSISAQPGKAWTVDAGGKAGPLSISNGRLFVPVIDRHLVMALDAETGKRLWAFTAGGRVDTPPTIHCGMALFGSADGWIYCLRASDGQLVWKRMIAPQARLVGSMGQLESAWPAHGSVLIEDDVATVTAGRSSYLDGGIHVYRLKPATGEIIESKVIYSPEPDTDKMPRGEAHDMPGFLSDILAAAPSGIWMRRNKIIGDDSRPQHAVYATGGFRDDTWFNRTTWAVGDMKHAQLLIFDEKNAFGIAAFTSASRARAFTPGDRGYRLYAKPLKSTASAPAAGKGKSKGKDRKKGKSKTAGSPDTWSVYIPVRGTAMALANDKLFVAGAPDIVDASDPLGAFDGRKGAILSSYSSKDGKQLSELKLDSLPVWDGMAAANGKLYLSMQDGSIICLE